MSLYFISISSVCLFYFFTHIATSYDAIRRNEVPRTDSQLVWEQLGCVSDPHTGQCLLLSPKTVRKETVLGEA